MSAGKKSFYFRYTCLDKRKVVVIGSCDSLSLSEARERAISLQQKLNDGIGPAAEKKQELMVSQNQEQDKNKEDFLFKNIAKKFVRERALNGYWKNCRGVIRNKPVSLHHIKYVPPTENLFQILEGAFNHPYEAN